VPDIADWCAVHLIRDDHVEQVAVAHSDPQKVEFVARLQERYPPDPDAPSGAIQVSRSGEPAFLPDIPDDLLVAAAIDDEHLALIRSIGLRSALVVPLLVRGHSLGALTLVHAESGQRFDEVDLTFARQLASTAAVALDNARLYEQQRRLAEGLQRSLLTEPPQPDHAEIVVRYRPAMEVAQVGGDWYDAFLQPPGATMVVIGDVVGHDTEAAAAMGQLRGMLRGIAYRAGVGPSAVLTDLDAAIEGLGMGTMATAAIARVETTAEEWAAGTARLRWCNAGHPPPLLLHRDGHVEELSGAGSELMLGVDPTTHRTDSVVTVARGATLLLYTDGLVEGRDLPLDDGIARLREALEELADRPLAELCDAVIDRLRPEGLQDDVALVAVRLHPEDRPRPPAAGPERLPPGFR
jgi:serine phosphatase RsbU (regulator of sigma subunit)